MSQSPTTGRLPAATSLLVAAGAALAAGELAGGSVRSWQSPVQVVAEVVIDRAPSPIVEFGIDTFGTNDKPALIVTILIVIAIVAVVAGIAARRRPWIVTVVFAVFAAVGAAAAWDRYGLWAAGPAVIAGAVGVVVWRILIASADAATATSEDDGTAEPAGRRAFLVGSAAFVAVSVAAVGAGRALRSRFSAAASRAALVLPTPATPLGDPAAATSFAIEGITPLFTANDDFYRVDTALVVPQLPVEDWSLRVTGMVDRDKEFDFEQLVALGVIETDITLTCVSNQVGGGLVGNARWLGVPLRTVLDEAGVDVDADQIVGRSSDGYTCGFPASAAYDRDAIVAIGMNGEPLPLEHGFPARLVTPGLYGYISATKWLTEIELTRFDSFEQYWVPRGYADRAPIKTMARIDVPRTGQTVPAGETTVAGVAWSQPDGISRVEIKIDDGDFAEAELAEPLGDNTWRQWRYRWNADAGSHRVTVRATDGRGRTQTEQRAPVLPDGASGWQSLLVIVA